ncbi:MAG: GNAT family N-acetyltransferase [Limnochordia bacterium]|jgi:RimJ/RimL family protein N-acetyltransferase
MNLVGERVYLRPLEKRDLPIIINWGKNPDLQRFMDGEYPQTIDEGEVWLEETKKNRHAVLVGIVTKDGRLIGDIELSHISWRRGDCELRIRIGEDADRNRGFGTDALSTILEYAFLQLGLKLVYLRVYSFNQRAIRCYEKCGLRKRGRLWRRSGNMAQEIILMQIQDDQFIASRKPGSATG